MSHHLDRHRRGRRVDAAATIRLATWNLEWAQPGTARGERVAKVLDGLADVMVCTECELGSLPEGHVVDAGTDWGYPLPRAGRRKVAMWSRHPWTDVSRYEEVGLPPGRIVAATTVTPVGPLRVVGVCIPWNGAHVSTGRKDRAPWQDHTEFLELLPHVLRSLDGPFVIAGDFNQRIPRVRQPIGVAELLGTALGDLLVPTSGPTPYGQLIDHVAVSEDLDPTSTEFLPDRDASGRLSDHTGAVVTVERRTGP